WRPTSRSPSFSASRCPPGCCRCEAHHQRQFEERRTGRIDARRRDRLMETLESLLHGFGVALTLTNLLWAFVGVTLGTIVGILPGIGPALTVALLLPVTYGLDPVGSFIMFAGIYYGGMYGGSTTSILLNTPGESASIITAVEGNLMARRGRGAAALATAAIGSFVA